MKHSKKLLYLLLGITLGLIFGCTLSHFVSRKDFVTVQQYDSLYNSAVALQQQYHGSIYRHRERTNVYENLFYKYFNLVNSMIKNGYLSNSAQNKQILEDFRRNISLYRSQDDAGLDRSIENAENLIGFYPANRIIKSTPPRAIDDLFLIVRASQEEGGFTGSRVRYRQGFYEAYSTVKAKAYEQDLHRHDILEFPLF
jgi:hypothetical protein